MKVYFRGELEILEMDVPCFGNQKGYICLRKIVLTLVNSISEIMLLKYVFLRYLD